MQLFDFLKKNVKPKPHETIENFAAQMDSRCTVGQVVTIPDSSIPQLGKLKFDEDAYIQLEAFLFSAVAGLKASSRKAAKAEDVEKVIDSSIRTGVLRLISTKIEFFSAETRRLACAIWGYLLKIEHPRTREKSVLQHLGDNSVWIRALFISYNTPTGAEVTIGIMLRDCFKSHRILDYVLREDLLLLLFPVLTCPNFDVAADAFQTLREVLTNHKDVSCSWLLKNFDKFFGQYMRLLDPSSTAQEGYVTIRQALSVLSTILLDRQFMHVMIQFANSDAFLKSVLLLLGHSSKIVQHDSFHIFKVFAANPNKTPKIHRLLFQNRERIIKLLDKIENDRIDDQEFRMDKVAVVAKLEALAAPPTKATPLPGPHAPVAASPRTSEDEGVDH